MANIEPLLSRPGLRFKLGSARDEPLVRELLDECDCTVHLAAAVGVRLIVEHPVRTIETNVQATEVLLKASCAKRQPVLLASTSEVYGKSARVPFREEDDLCLGATVRSRWAYACSKALDEWLGFAYMRERGVPLTVARLFNTVGPRQVGRYGMVLPGFARQALQGLPLTVYGDGTQTRCFAHVDDVTQALLLLLCCDKARGQVVNIGTDREISILHLAELVRSRAQSSSEIRFIPYSAAYAEGFEDMARRVPDISRLKTLTGFRPGIPLETIIDDVLADQRNKEKAPERRSFGPPLNPPPHAPGTPA